MKIMAPQGGPDAGDVHLTYCTNIHPGETWAEVDANLRTHVLAVKSRVSPGRPFGVGLRLSSQAAHDLAQPGALPAFRAFLAENDLYVFTINGFPYGPFHGAPVKENVYRPDWREGERVAYTTRLADILAACLPSSLAGSISTVPGCFRPLGEAPETAHVMADNIRAAAAHLARIHDAGGPLLGLAFEPEPHCAWETTAEAVAFFLDHLLSRAAVERFARLTGHPPAAAEERLRRHLGLCLDACHAAVEFESPAEAVALPARAGIQILKLQVSAGLRIPAPTPEAWRALDRFAEGVYLHQTVVRRGGDLVRFLDLPEALAAARAGQPSGDEWRVHFHVPLFRASLPPFENTQAFLRALLALQRARPFTHHVEVETYTWDVLPEEFRREHVDDAIARELTWTLDALAPAPP